MTLASAMSTVQQMSPRQRVVAGLALLAAVAAFAGVLRLATAPTMALLYSGLDPAAAGDVIQSLEQQGARYEVRGGAIFVDGALRDSLRMTLAAEGKPANGAAGYELLDSLSGFGTTSQMFDVAYWRAKEGELARTIMASPSVRSARVHISNVQTRPFARGGPLGASVSVLPAGGGIPAEQAAAFGFLVASAVAGLDPADVTVIDVRAGQVVSSESGDLAQGGNLRADDLRRRAERLLEARVGPGNVVVEVSVETVTDREQIVERTLDPDARVLISSEVEERSTASTDQRAGAVTVASNLPEGDAAAGGPQATTDETETRERSNFEVSETTREFVRGPGGIQRITVAVLVNEPAAPDGSAGPTVGRGTGGAARPRGLGGRDQRGARRRRDGRSDAVLVAGVPLGRSGRRRRRASCGARPHATDPGRHSRCAGARARALRRAADPDRTRAAGAGRRPPAESRGAVRRLGRCGAGDPRAADARSGGSP
jgi:flagellar M-ring protein FliF